MMKKLEDALLDFSKAHGATYSYTKVDYRGAKVPITIMCKEHGEFMQTPDAHKQGKGCKYCGFKTIASKLASSAGDFISRASVVHDNLYTYTDVVYKNNTTKVIITCRQHGNYPQIPANHLNGAGCPECKKIRLREHRKLVPVSWTYTNWENRGSKSSNFDSYKLYIIECYGNNEHFYKIGKTFTTVSKRFEYNIIPYKYRIIYLEGGEARYISDKEAKQHNENKQYKYTPKLSFSGRQECYSNLIGLPYG